MKHYLAPALLVLALLAHADQKMDIILQQGTSAYEDGEYQKTLNHFTARLIYSMQSDNPPAYLCNLISLSSLSPSRVMGGCR